MRWTEDDGAVAVDAIETARRRAACAANGCEECEPVPDDDPQRFHRDEGKPRWTLVPVRAMRSVLDVFDFGARKYGARTYLDVPDAIPRYAESLFRHVEHVKEALQDEGAAGILARDAESGLPHLAHAVTDGVILLDLAIAERLA